MQLTFNVGYNFKTVLKYDIVMTNKRIDFLKIIAMRILVPNLYQFHFTV